MALAVKYALGVFLYFVALGTIRVMVWIAPKLARLDEVGVADGSVNVSRALSVAVASDPSGCGGDRIDMRRGEGRQKH